MRANTIEVACNKDVLNIFSKHYFSSFAIHFNIDSRSVRDVLFFDFTLFLKHILSENNRIDRVQK